MQLISDEGLNTSRICTSQTLIRLLDNFGQYLVQHFFATLDEKPFVQDLLELTDMHVSHSSPHA